MDSSPNKEVCCKQIYINQTILDCNTCHEILHFKYGKIIHTYNQTTNQWPCSNCYINFGLETPQVSTFSFKHLISTTNNTPGLGHQI